MAVPEYKAHTTQTSYPVALIITSALDPIGGWSHVHILNASALNPATLILRGTQNHASNNYPWIHYSTPSKLVTKSARIVVPRSPQAPQAIDHWLQIPALTRNSMDRVMALCLTRANMWEGTGSGPLVAAMRLMGVMPDTSVGCPQQALGGLGLHLRLAGRCNIMFY
ncbi:hypothetical protein BD779DRAFT_1478656 [Infundibulicybe gibba]|nr:hypothetical protein BD779DRAFT_1478656 [Infundibulicybe gibba]